MPPAVFAKATMVLRAPAGDERSRLNSSVLPSVRLSRVVRSMCSEAYYEVKSASKLPSKRPTTPSCLWDGRALVADLSPSDPRALHGGG
jgi:hypothetical protein